MRFVFVYRQQPWVKFATFTDVLDIKHKTYRIILKKGGCIVPDDTTLLSLEAGQCSTIYPRKSQPASLGHPILDQSERLLQFSLGVNLGCQCSVWVCRRPPSDFFLKMLHLSFQLLSKWCVCPQHRLPLPQADRPGNSPLPGQKPPSPLPQLRNKFCLFLNMELSTSLCLQNRWIRSGSSWCRSARSRRRGASRSTRT